MSAKQIVSGDGTAELPLDLANEMAERMNDLLAELRCRLRNLETPIAVDESDAPVAQQWRAHAAFLGEYMRALDGANMGKPRLGGIWGVNAEGRKILDEEDAHSPCA